MSTRRSGARRRLAIATVVAVALAGACSSGDDTNADDESGDGLEQAGDGGGTGTTAEAAPLPDGYEGYTSDLYADDANWLCRPGNADNVCARDLDATVVNADGSTEVVPHEVAEAPSIDCFYVYPTTSYDTEINSDLVPGESEEIVTVLNQAARLTSTCRVFAPVYRQVTLGGIGGDADAPQGVGSGVGVPEGELVGGSFQEVRLCEATDQVGCVVTYASFRATSPPPDDSLFGRARDGEGEAGCVNPGSPSGGSATLSPYFSVDQPEGSLLGGLSSAQPFADAARTSEITTPWVTYPDLVEAECVREDGFHYLRLTVLGDPDDPRTDDIPGDLAPNWGMHLVDANVAMGDIEAMVATQPRPIPATADA